MIARDAGPSVKAIAASRRKAAALRVLHVGAEIFPLLKTGGLADVLGALPVALRRAGVDARVLLPAFPALLSALSGVREVGALQPHWGGAPAQLLAGHFAAAPLAGVPIYLLRHEALFGRAGNPYSDANGVAYGDNHRRFALLALATTSSMTPTADVVAAPALPSLVRGGV